ncbi:hypothetical protein ACFVSN_40505 [Kitasatospora sp. NPDC057904]|uniref:hypothetical protein n=1 Tax=unclassified Kitasatospora TaxID=2633591 RepID=UPI0036DAD8A7
MRYLGAPHSRSASRRSSGSGSAWSGQGSRGGTGLLTDRLDRLRHGLTAAALAEARELSDAAVRRLDNLGLHEAGGAVLADEATLAALVGDGPAALRHAHEAQRLLAAHPHATFHLFALADEADALRLLGRHDESERAWQDAAERCRASGALHLEAAVEQRYADFLLSVGRAREAAEHLGRAREFCAESGDTRGAAELAARISAIGA